MAATVAAGRTRLVVDPSEVVSMDSSGLGALVSGLRAARQAGGDLRIVGVTGQVAAVLEVTRLDRVLPPYSTVADATQDW